MSRRGRYSVECWVPPGVQVAERHTDDRAEAFRFVEELRAKYGAERPAVVVFDNERDGRPLDEDEVQP